MKLAAKRLVAHLPWGARKLVNFIALHGLWNLLRSKPVFRGVYHSFGEVAGTTLALQSELAQSALEGARHARLDEASGLPVLRFGRSLLPLAAAMVRNAEGSVNILDFGGGAGVDFNNLLYALPDGSDVRYHIVDLPAVCDAGRERWKDDRRIRFYETLPSNEMQFDLVYSWSAIHYVAEPLKLLETFTRYRPKAILIVASPFTSGSAFVRVQTNRSVPFPHWVLSVSEAEANMRGLGYQLAVRIAGEEDYDVDNYAPEYRVPGTASLLFLKV